MAAGLRFFPHYYLQVIPPLALLAGRGLVSHAFFTRRAGIALVAVLALVPVAYYLPAAFEQRTDRNLRLALAAAAYAREHTKPGDRILVWGQAPEVYWASDRRPATRFPTTGFVTGASGGRPADRVGPQYATPGAMEDFLADLQAAPADADLRHVDGRPAQRGLLPSGDGARLLAVPHPGELATRRDRRRHRRLALQVGGVHRGADHVHPDRVEPSEHDVEEVVLRRVDQA